MNCYDNYLFMNYAFQDAQDAYGKNLPFAVKYKGYFGINVAPCRCM
ncbi:hypothetical protein KsCSTR_22400 [Candidatus Kuenenia stuttgartiensis]|uniref:Uncharacterized protein n=1 Tax=Kuenenia stuttgartiensis TaxID=174633 RepID=A0A6G7GQN2_KUEST|nr:hypothetical protein KsCSTR_22400 [Candidatus Kuenenia stuttgartiensis]